MTLFRTAVCLLVLVPAALPQTGKLTSGVPRRFTIPAQPLPFTQTGFSIAVPPGAMRLTIDLKGDVPLNALILWARFDRPLAVDSGGLVTAFDYSAQTLNSGIQQLVVTAASNPPLQTGTYYVGIGVSSLNTAIAGTLMATVQGGPGGTFLISTFDWDTQGWSRNYPGSLLPGASLSGDSDTALFRSSTGGNPGAYLQMTDNSSPFGVDNPDFALAPAKFLGNLEALANARMEFDFQRFSGPPDPRPLRLVIIGNDAAFQWVSPEPPEGGWNHYIVGLKTGSLVRAAGTAPLSSVLANVQRIELSMDQSEGGLQEINGLDNFALKSDSSPAPPANQPVPAAPVVSTFDADSDGWRRNYPPVDLAGSTFGDSGSGLSWSVDGGLAGGGLAYSESGGGADDCFVAPPKFLGNIGGIPNPRLEFDYRHVPSGTPGTPGYLLVRVIGAGSSYVWRGAGPGAFGQWQHFAVPLNAAVFVQESGTATFAQVLAAVVRLEISADQIDTAETDVLDNVRLLNAAAPPVLPQLQFSPATLTFTTAGDGSNPAPQALRISSSGDPSLDAGGPLNWTVQVDPNANWLTLSQTTGTTPTIVTITASAAGLAAGTHTATLTITAVGASNSPQSFTITLTVTPPISAQPRLDSVVNAASFRGPLAAGTLASAFGVNFGGTTAGESTGYLPNTQDLPRIFRGVRVVLREPGAELGVCPILFLKDDQINFQLPYDVAIRTSVQIVIDNNGVQSAPVEVALAPAAPGLFTFPNNRAVVQNQDFSLNGPNNAATRGNTIIAYLTGAGVVTPGVPTGQPAPSNPLATATTRSSATIGGTAARVAFFGLTPGLVGLAQANIEVAPSTPTGEQLLLFSVGSQAANAAIVSIR